MTISMTLFTFVNIWCLLMFAVTPFFIRPAENHAAHEYAAAPKSIGWKKALLVNTLLAVIVTAALAMLIRSGIIPLHNL